MLVGPLGNVIDIARIDPTAHARGVLRHVVTDERAGNAYKEYKTNVLQWFENWRPPPITMAAIERRQEAFVRLAGSGWAIRTFWKRTEWRLAIGTGNQDSALETSISLDATLGIPVIPGSAIKGVVRRTFPSATYLDRAPDASNPKATVDDVMIFDALAGPSTRIVREVMTPHFGPYYRGAPVGPVADPPPLPIYSPNPIEFLAVEGPFLFAVAARTEDDANVLFGMTMRALDDLGIGAKTAAGYGYFA